MYKSLGTDQIQAKLITKGNILLRCKNIIILFGYGRNVNAAEGILLHHL